MLLPDIADQTVPSAQVDNRKGMNIIQQEINHDEAAVPGDGSVRQIIDQELKYKRELWRLQKILRRGMASEDPLPVFNRRHLLLLVKRLCKDMEYSTSQLGANMDISRMSEVLQNATPVSHGLLCIAYADTLYEIREFLKREMTRRNDSSITICQELHAERSLLPLHRLKYLKSLSCISPQHSEVISSALDGCYVAISSLHSQRFVGEVDRLLDFALNMDPPPNQYYSACRITAINKEASNKEKNIGSMEENVYEEIAPYIPKKKKGFFSRRGKMIMNNKDISAQEEFIPLATYPFKIKEIFA